MNCHLNNHDFYNTQCTDLPLVTMASMGHTVLTFR